MITLSITNPEFRDKIYDEVNIWGQPYIPRSPRRRELVERFSLALCTGCVFGDSIEDLKQVISHTETLADELLRREQADTQKENL